ncbi:MAG: acyltransferase family protein [Uliginosibacterium sp.]|nr:acyltransferase family protein [Uliginosibacterium sp.]
MTTPALPPRAVLLDPIRIVLTLLVILHHTAITYGGGGDWYYKEAGAPEWMQRLLSILTATNQSFFMGFFFLLAGYLTPGPLARKGETAYLGERLWRLGFPILIFGHLLQPLTVALSRAAEGSDFWPTLQQLLAHNTFGLGPLWFNQALILFAVAWCFAPRVEAGFLSRCWPTGFHARVVLLVVLTSLFAFILRLAVPAGRNLIGMQIGYFGSYIVLFVTGALVARSRMLEAITWRQAGPWLLVSALSFPTLWLYALFGGAFNGQDWRGGWNLPALAYACWEPFVAAGILLGMLAFFRGWRHSEAALCRRLSDASFIAFIVHAPLVVAASWAVQGLVAHPMQRFLVAATLACLASFALGDILTRALACWRMKRFAAARPIA